MDSMTRRYGYSLDSETFYGANYDTREAALEAAVKDAREQYGDGPIEVWTAEADFLKPGDILADAFDIDWLIEQAEDHASDDHPWLEDELFNQISKVDGDAIEAAIRDLIRTWATPEVINQSAKYEAGNVERHVIGATQEWMLIARAVEMAEGNL